MMQQAATVRAARITEKLITPTQTAPQWSCGHGVREGQCSGGTRTSRPHLAREARPAPAQPRAAAAGPRDVRGPASEPGGGGAPGEAALVAPEVGLQPAAVRVDTAEHPVLSSPPVNGVDSRYSYIL